MGPGLDARDFIAHFAIVEGRIPVSLEMSTNLSPDSILSIILFLRRFGYGLPLGMIFLENVELLKKEGLSSIIAFVQDLTSKERVPISE